MRKFTEILRPYSITFSGIHGAIVGTSDQELAELHAACKKANSTNCWWADYRAAQGILPEVEAEIRRRRGAAKRIEATLPEPTP